MPTPPPPSQKRPGAPLEKKESAKLPRVQPWTVLFTIPAGVDHPDAGDTVQQSFDVRPKVGDIIPHKGKQFKLTEHDKKSWWDETNSDDEYDDENVVMAFKCELHEDAEPLPAKKKPRVLDFDDADDEVSSTPPLPDVKVLKEMVDKASELWAEWNKPEVHDMGDGLEAIEHFKAMVEALDNQHAQPPSAGYASARDCLYQKLLDAVDTYTTSKGDQQTRMILALDPF
jgi:hypothetical protein